MLMRVTVLHKSVMQIEYEGQPTSANANVTLTASAGEGGHRDIQLTLIFSANIFRKERRVAVTKEEEGPKTRKEERLSTLLSTFRLFYINLIPEISTLISNL